MTESTAPRMALLVTDRATDGMDEEASGPATIQATSSRAMTETPTPPMSSRRRPRSLVMACRSRAPAQAAIDWPSSARPNTASSDTTMRDSGLSRCSTISGASCRPTSAPPKKPTNDSAPMRKP